MDQELPQDPAIEQELQAAGGLPFTHDKLFREVFQWIELAKSFLRFKLPTPILEKLELDGLTVEPKDFLSVVFRETRADMIYRVPIRGHAADLCVYVLLEHKSYNDVFTIFQADQYAGQLSQEELRLAIDEKRLTVDFRLSPVLVVIFYHGETPFTGPVDVAHVYEDYGVFADYLPHRRAILFDLSLLTESELPDDPEVPELYAVLRIMQVIFSTDIGTKSRVVLERLRPYSEIPKYRRLIRFLWYYLGSNARRVSKREMLSVTEVVKQVIGEKNMPTFFEELAAEGKAKGKAEVILAILRTKFHHVSNEVENAVRQISDPIALDSWAVHAAMCQSFEEFENAIC
jgi:hypothetical protein